MNLQQLYYFQAISRLKNYTKAAEQLLVAQSSLSHSIGDLERELGVPLFFKVGRNIDITEYGKQFLIHVDRITAELELANQELKNMLNPNMGKIRIALAYTVSNRFIPNMIKGFTKMRTTGPSSLSSVKSRRQRSLTPLPTGLSTWGSAPKWTATNWNIFTFLTRRSSPWSPAAIPWLCAGA